MDSDDKHFQVLYKGLKILSESAFPKACGFCGRVYHTVDEYLRDSKPVVSGSGLKQTRDDDKTIIDLFRNCICGSTLMESFSNRRDMSEAGLKRREVFARIQSVLVKKGFSPRDARKEILKLMRGESSKALEKMGIKVHR